MACLLVRFWLCADVNLFVLGVLGLNWYTESIECVFYMRSVMVSGGLEKQMIVMGCSCGSARILLSINEIVIF